MRIAIFGRLLAAMFLASFAVDAFASDVPILHARVTIVEDILDSRAG